MCPFVHRIRHASESYRNFHSRGTSWALTLLGDLAHFVAANIGHVYVAVYNQRREAEDLAILVGKVDMACEGLQVSALYLLRSILKACSLISGAE